jgi:hypothetical protein
LLNPGDDVRYCRCCAQVGAYVKKPATVPFDAGDGFVGCTAINTDNIAARSGERFRHGRPKANIATRHGRRFTTKIETRRKHFVYGILEPDKQSEQPFGRRVSSEFDVASGPAEVVLYEEMMPELHCVECPRMIAGRAFENAHRDPAETSESLEQFAEKSKTEILKTSGRRLAATPTSTLLRKLDEKERSVGPSVEFDSLSSWFFATGEVLVVDGGWMSYRCRKESNGLGRNHASKY